MCDGENNIRSFNGHIVPHWWAQRGCGMTMWPTGGHSRAMGWRCDPPVGTAGLWDDDVTHRWAQPSYRITMWPTGGHSGAMRWWCDPPVGTAELWDDDVTLRWATAGLWDDDVTHRWAQPSYGMTMWPTGVHSRVLEIRSVTYRWAQPGYISEDDPWPTGGRSGAMGIWSHIPEWHVKQNMNN